MKQNVTGMVPAMKFKYKCIKQHWTQFTVLGKHDKLSIRWWPFILWYLISESQKSLLFVNRPLSCRQRDTYTANKHYFLYYSTFYITMFEGDLLLLQTKGWLHLNSELYPELPMPPLSLGRAGRGVGEPSARKIGHTGSWGHKVPKGEVAGGYCPGMTWWNKPHEPPPSTQPMGVGPTCGDSEGMGPEGQNAAPSAR